MKNLLAWTSPCLLVLSVGCFGGGVDLPDTSPVSGAVMYNGQPVAGATVSFMADGAPRVASGVTNAAGEFQLSTFGVNDGAVAGDHKIMVTKIVGDANAGNVSDPTNMDDPSNLTNTYTEMMKGGGVTANGPANELPAKYGNLNTTPLKETVTLEGPNQFVLQLSD